MKKNVLVAYLLWCIGGWCSLHLLYLRRDKQALVYWCSLGGYLGCGILRDFFRLPAYVREANEDNKYMREITEKMRRWKRPPVSIARAVGQVLVGNLWGLLAAAAVPQEDLFFGWSVASLCLLVAPLAAAVGVWLIGNIGRERGGLLWPVIGSYLVLLAVPVIGKDVTNWCSVGSMAFFNKMAKKWRRTHKPKTSFCRRAMYLGTGWLLFSSLFCSFLYFNATLENDGDPIKFRDAVGNFLRSPMVEEFKVNAKKVYDDSWTLGFSQSWANFIELMDPSGQRHALKVLELPKNATQRDIKERVRSLSKTWHPDKHKGEDEKQRAQQMFMEIQQAGDVLLDNKRRRRKNSDAIPEE